MDKITVYTRAYNTKPYLEQCISSVLSQTYSDLEYVIIDNGCTDGSSEIIKEYADRDKRVKVIRYEVNSRMDAKEILKRTGCGDFVTFLDSDDWWEPNYLERLLELAKSTAADIVVTGTNMHVMEDGSVFKRIPKTRVLLDRMQFAEAFPFYHEHFRTNWAKLIRSDTYFESKILTPDELNALGIVYGSDTLFAFALLRQAERIYMDDSALHHYRIHKKSLSYVYNSKRAFSDQYLYNDMEDFLRSCGALTPQNRKFLNEIYANAVNDTLKVMNGAKGIMAEEKLAELEKIAEYPHTKKIFSMEELSCRASKEIYIVSVIACAVQLNGNSDDRISAIAKLCMPSCGAALNTQSARLFWEQRDLLVFLINDDRLGLVQHLMKYIKENKFAKLYDLGEIVADLSWDKPLLREIKNGKFFKKYSEIYLFVWQEKYEEALKLMTDTLLKKEIPCEDFLLLYSNLSALLERVDEFIFSKLRLATFYFAQKRFEECKNILTDLEEMGVEDTEEIAQIKQQCNEIVL